MEQFIQDITKEAGKVVLEMFGKTDVKYTKHDVADVVTEADLKSNEILMNRIKETYPDHGMISEEMSEEEWGGDKEYVWIIDPIDGTRNFATGVPVFGVMVGLMKDGEMLMAAIYMPVTDDLYFAEAGKGAFINNKNITCCSLEVLECSFGLLPARLCSEDVVNLRKNIVGGCLGTTSWINSLSCTAACMTLIASGKRDWYVTTGVNIWDMAPGALILRESGCKITDIYGDEWKMGSYGMIAANPTLHEKILKIVGLEKK